MVVIELIFITNSEYCGGYKDSTRPFKALLYNLEMVRCIHYVCSLYCLTLQKKFFVVVVEK